MTIAAALLGGLVLSIEPQAAPVHLIAFLEGRGSPLVMVGCGTVGAAEFEPHAHVLADDYRVIRLQTINVERSQTHEALPAGYSIRTESAAMARTLDRLKIDNPIDLVGHSLGALIALDYALDHPHRIHTLTLVEPPAFWIVPAAELRESKDMRAMYELTRELTPDREPTDGQLARFRCVLGTCVEPPSRDHAASWQDWEKRRAALRGLSAVAEHTDDPERLKTLRRPVLIVTGAQTVSFHRRIDELLASGLPIVERIELQGGHSAVASAPEAFISELRAFLARHRFD